MYEVTVVAADSTGKRGMMDVTVTVENEEEDGTVTLSAVQPRVGIAFTASVTDPDSPGGLSDVEWQWYRGSYPTATLPTAECADATGSDCEIKGAESASYTPKAGDVGGELTAVAMYTDGKGEDEARQDSANPVGLDTENRAPKFPDQDAEMDGDQTAQSREIPENTMAGVDIGDGDPVVATDPNGVTDILTYTLGGSDASSFGIESDTGQLLTKAALNFETKPTHTVEVTATDSFGASATVEGDYRAHRRERSAGDRRNYRRGVRGER